MDEKKEPENTGINTQNGNNLNYSFNFANQVTEEPKVEPVQNNINEMTSDNVETLNVTPQAPVTPEVTPVMPQAPVTPEVTPVASTVTETAETTTGDATETNETSDVKNPEAPADDSEELIKDKKATSKFLCILFLLLIAFIIALPFIVRFLG